MGIFAIEQLATFMKLEDSQTGNVLRGVVEKAREKQLSIINKTRNFIFDWEVESGNEIFLIRVEGKEECLGLISLVDKPEELRIHINLIESAIKYRGKNKAIKNIPGCLISYACKLAFKKGYGGFVSLTPKTKLKDYYRNVYGFIEMGTQMAVYQETSNYLIEIYSDYEEI